MAAIWSSPAAAPCFELRELFGRVVRLVHPHHLHDLREL
jgi:hypothetical protein